MEMICPLCFNAFKSTSEFYGLFLNIQKTNLMMIGDVNDKANQLAIDNNVVENVNSFIYISAQIHKNGHSNMAI